MARVQLMDGQLAALLTIEAQIAQFVCPETEEPYIREISLNEYQRHRLILGDQVAQPFACPCGTIHWYAIVYPPTFHKMERMREQELVIWQQ